ncbi:hypothetical protein H8E77_06195 [bacterium]|nr:hypothetical protein [bacterium]
MFRRCSSRLYRGSQTLSVYGLSIGIGLSVFFVLAFSVCANEYELQYKVSDLRKEGMYTSGQFLRPSIRSEEKLSAEPKYRSKTPVYAVVTLGSDADSKYTIVIDESKGTGRGYDVLYADSNNNENLTDDRKIAGRIRQQGKNFTVGNYGPVEVMINYGDRMVPYYFSVEYNLYGAQKIQLSGRDRKYIGNMNLRLEPSGYYTGVVSFGESERRIAVVDFNCNGIFNEYFMPRSDIRGPEERLYAIGDQILIDLNGDGRFERGHTGNKELYPYAKYLQVDGNWYSLDIPAHGNNVKVQTPSLKFGTIKIPSKPGSCSLQLVSSNGIMKFEETGKEFQVPTDVYRLYAHTTQVKDSSVNWRYEANGTASGKQFQVSESDVLELSFSAPLLVNVSYYNRSGGRSGRLKAGNTIELSLTLSGQGGEIYTNVQKGHDRPPAPTFVVVDESGKNVAEGTFEYG